MQHIAEPGDVAHEERVVEVVARGDLGDLLRGAAARAEEERERAARGDVEQPEHQEGGHQQHQQEAAEPAQGVTQDGHFFPLVPIAAAHG